MQDRGSELKVTVPKYLHKYSCVVMNFLLVCVVIAVIRSDFIVFVFHFFFLRDRYEVFRHTMDVLQRQRKQATSGQPAFVFLFEIVSCTGHHA